jgi:hypothetical protein
MSRRQPQSRQLGGELVGLADLLVEQGRGRVAAQLADTARECSGRVAQLRACVGGRGDDGLADERWFVAGLDRGGDQRVDGFAASRVERKRFVGRDGVRVRLSGNSAKTARPVPGLGVRERTARRGGASGR